MIVNELPKQYRELIISCENPRIIGDQDAEIVQYEPCCECVPCKTIIASNYYGIGEYPEKYHNGLIMHHARQLRKFNYNVIDENGVDYFEKMCELEPRNEPCQLEIDFEGAKKSIEIENSKSI